MKAFVSYILVFAFVFQMLEVSVIYFNFKINQDYIAEYLCINKEKPELNCQGCCQLNKELEEQSDRDKKREETVNPEKPSNFILEIDTFSCNYHPSVSLFLFSTYHNKFCNNNPNQVFHPPKITQIMGIRA